MHVDLDAFFVEVCRRHFPELRDVELLVVGGRRDSRGVVQSASYGARRFGVRSGMPIAQAARLCPGATFVKGSFPLYRQASRQVRAVLAGFAPMVAMASLDEGYLDFSGTDALHPVSLLPVAQRIRLAIQAETGLDCSIGIGPNAMIAKLASDFAKPRGLMEVRAGWEAGFVAGLPLRALPGIGPRTAERYAALGLTEVAQVQRMPHGDLARLVGEDDARVLAFRAAGRGRTVLRPDDAPKSVSRETTLSRDLDDHDELDRILGALVSRVAAQLRGEGLTARRVTLKLRHGDFRTVSRQVTLPDPTDLDAELRAAARRLLAGEFPDVRRRGHGVRLIGVAASLLTADAGPGLFDPPERSRLRDLTRAVDRVRARYGFNALRPGDQLGASTPRRDE